MGWRVLTATGGVKAGSSVTTVSVGGSLLGHRVFTAPGSATYTPTAGTASIVVEGVGGGGGGGGATTGTAGSSGLAQAGTGAGYFRVRLTANFSGATYVVGAKGSGGAAGNNNGTDGADTTFTTTAGTPVVYTAGKGLLGLAAAANATGAPPTHRGSSSAGGTVTNGDVQIAGGSTVPGWAVSTSHAAGMKGGDSQLGKGGLYSSLTAINTSAAGGNATGYGGGGSGGSVLGSGGSVAGGDGTPGVIIIWEYA